MGSVSFALIRAVACDEVTTHRYVPIHESFITNSSVADWSAEKPEPDRKPEEAKQERNQEGQVVALKGKQVLPFCKGRFAHCPRQVVASKRRQIALRGEAGPSRKKRQVSVARLFGANKIVAFQVADCLLRMKRPVMRLESDGI